MQLYMFKFFTSLGTHAAVILAADQPSARQALNVTLQKLGYFKPESIEMKCNVYEPYDLLLFHTQPLQEG